MGDELTYRDDVFPYVPVLVLFSVWLLLLLGYLLVRELRSLRRYVNLHHGVLTAVGTMDGLVKALEAGLESGELGPRTRGAIYRAHDEQVQHVYDISLEISGVERGEGAHTLLFDG